MPAKYHEVSPDFWARTRRWTDSDRLLALYLTTCEHRNTEGLYRLPKGYVHEDLGWAFQKIEKSLAVVTAGGLALYDESASVVLLPRALAEWSPSTEKQLVGASRRLQRVPETTLWPAFMAACREHCPRLAALLDPTPPPGNAHSEGHADDQSNGHSDAHANGPRGCARTQPQPQPQPVKDPPTPTADAVGATALTRKREAIKVVCPECAAAPGAGCTTSDGAARQSQHQARHAAAIAAGAPALGDASRRNGTSPRDQGTNDRTQRLLEGPMPLPPKDRDRKRHPGPTEEQLAWAAHHFPGQHPNSVVGAAAHLRFRKTEPTVEALRALGARNPMYRAVA